MTKNFIFIRHGESDANAGNHLVKPNSEISLTERGAVLSRSLANTCANTPSDIYISEFKRANQTAVPLCQKYQITTTELSLLNEFDAIDFDIEKKLTQQEKLALIKRYWLEANPKERIGVQAETYKEFCQRVSQFKLSLPSLNNESFIIGHGMWFAQFIWQTLGLDDGKPSQNMKGFGNFFLNMPISNLDQFHISIINHNVSLRKIDISLQI